MKKKLLVIVCLLSILISINVSAAYVSKVVINTVEPVVGERHSFKASVPQSASTEVYEVHWAGEFDNGVFVQGYDYTITVKLRIKAGLPNNFATSSKINATINGKKAKVTHTTDVNSSKTKTITVRYTWKTLGGENPNDPKYNLKQNLKNYLRHTMLPMPLPIKSCLNTYRKNFMVLKYGLRGEVMHIHENCHPIPKTAVSMYQ